MVGEVGDESLTIVDKRIEPIAHSVEQQLATD